MDTYEQAASDIEDAVAAIVTALGTVTAAELAADDFTRRRYEHIRRLTQEALLDRNIVSREDVAVVSARSINVLTQYQADVS